MQWPIEWIWLYLKAECHYTVHTWTYKVYHLLWGHIEADSSEVHLAVVVHAGDDEEYTGTLRPACTRRTQKYSWVNVSLDKQNLFLTSQVWRLRLSHTPAQPKHTEVNLYPWTFDMWQFLYVVVYASASEEWTGFGNWPFMVLGRPKLGHWAINKIVSCWHYDDRVDWLPWYTCRGRRGGWPGWGGRRAASAAARSSRTQSCRRLNSNKQLFSTSQQILCQLSNLLNIIYCICLRSIPRDCDVLSRSVS